MGSGELGLRACSGESRTMDHLDVEIVVFSAENEAEAAGAAKAA
jgi:hypothetical protein